jgi:hypothetical protein
MASAGTDGAVSAPSPDVGAQESASYELLVGRLRQTGRDLHEAAEKLNAERSAVFATETLALVETDRLATATTAVARDVVVVGELTLFGYNVTATSSAPRTVGDVFELYRTRQVSGTDWDFTPVGPDETTFLDDADFVRDFDELYTYYALARLLSLRIVGDRLLMIFGIGDAADDVRVLRWRIGPDGPIYLDFYGEQDLVVPDRFDFSWIDVGRDSLVDGRDPHLSIDGEIEIVVAGSTIEYRIVDPVAGRTVVCSETLAAAGQDIAELKVAYARIGDLLLVRMLAYREPAERFYVYNRLTTTMVRDDLVGVNSRVLPGNQGIIFPGGYHLTNGEAHTFALEEGTWDFHTRHLAPNGEDVLYTYHDASTGRYLLCGYNMVTKSMANPVAVAGYALHASGVLIGLRETPDPARVHPISVYTSPFCTPERYAPPIASDSFFGRIGNPELVRVLGECFALTRDVDKVGFNAVVFEAFVARTRKLLDTYAWLSEPEAARIGELLVAMRRTAGDILDEFAAVQSARKAAHDALAEATIDVSGFLSDASAEITDADVFIERLTAGRARQGRLATLAELRFVDTAAVAELSTGVATAYESLAGRALEFLAGDDALASLLAQISDAHTAAGAATSAGPAREALVAVGDAGDRIVLLTEVVSALESDDAPLKTKVLTQLSDALAHRNAAAAFITAKVDELRAFEDRSQFAASVAVLTQRASAASMTATDAGALDVALAALDAEVETLEARFGDVAEFSETLADKRDEIYASLTAKRDTLAADRAKRLERIAASARRALDTVGARASKFGDRAEFEGFFATDPLVAKVRASIAELRELGEAGRAGELTVALDAVRTSARRAAADRTDLFGDDGTVRIGRQSFGINQTPFDVHLSAAHPDHLELRLSGTDLAVPVDHGVFGDLATAVAQAHPSETATMSRALYLAFEAHRVGITLAHPEDVAPVRAEAQKRLDEGFEVGVHDADATRIFAALTPLWATPGLYVDAADRSVAVEWLRAHDDGAMRKRLRALRALGPGRTRDAFRAEVSADLGAIADAAGVDLDVAAAVDYLLGFHDDVAVSAEAVGLAEAFETWATAAGLDVADAGFAPLARYVADWSEHESGAGPARCAEAALYLTDRSLPVVDVGLRVSVEGLLSTHETIAGGTITFDADVAFSAYQAYRRDDLARFAAAGKARRAFLAEARIDLGVEDLRAKPMPSFVRNTLIDEVYLPLIGDNFAKQLGMVGTAQGLLMLISPPGYGKTTLVEYVANLMGYALVKVNGPALGTGVTSLDPAAAPDAAAAAELEKLNRAFAMGTNVICYLDDIQHTSAELLSRFIPLCDATRRVDGVFNGEAHTWNLSGKRFVMVMAGNPYTGTGASFKLPDMLTNRADVHNLGDVVSGKADAFARSYLEIAAGSNATLAPVVASAREDLDEFLSSVNGEALDSSALSRAYPAAEVTAVQRVLGHLIRVRDEMLSVNAAYIRSATLDDTMRGEPPFLLQGSYRNMAKVASKVVGPMTDAEVDALIADHYRAEAQTLAGAASWNLARLAEVRGRVEPGTGEAAELRARWAEEKAAENPVVQVRAGLTGIEEALRSLPRPL